MSSAAVEPGAFQSTPPWCFLSSAISAWSSRVTSAETEMSSASARAVNQSDTSAVVVMWTCAARSVRVLGIPPTVCHTLPVTIIRATRLASSTWTPRGQSGTTEAAALAVEVEVVGSSVRLVPDLAWHLAAHSTMIYGETVIPADTLPAGVMAGHPAGSLAIRTQQSQPAPIYSDQGEDPEAGVVRLDLIQTISQDLADLGQLDDQRREIERLVSGLAGTIGPANPTTRILRPLRDSGSSPRPS